MDLHDLFDTVLVETGQFIIDREKIELDEIRFLKLVRRCLMDYNRYIPIVEKYNIDSPGRMYQFLEDAHPRGIPDWISDLKPIQILGTHPFYFEEFNRNMTNQYLEEETLFPWEYRKPYLYVPVSGKYDIDAIYKRVITETDTNGRKSYDVGDITIENDDAFFDILNARFLLALARNRRAFTMNELPIATDADSLASEARDQLEQALNELKQSEDLWYLSWS